MIRKLSATLAVLLLGVLFTGTAWAQEDDEPEQVQESDVPGEVQIKMNLQFARVLVNGESWEDAEFTSNGRTVIVRKLPRDTETKIRLEPIEGGYAPVELVVQGKEFSKKLTRKGKTRVISFVTHKTVTFKKAAEGTEDGGAAGDSGAKLDSKAGGDDME